MKYFSLHKKKRLTFMAQNLSPEIDSNKLFTHFSRVSDAIFIYLLTIFYNYFRSVWSNRQVCLIL